MSPEPMVVAPADRPRSLNVVGEQVTVLASGEQTGSFEIFFQAGPEGCGPPPHSHPWDEAFYVLRGEIHFVVDGLERTAGAGAMVFVPAGTLHCFRLGSGGAEALSITSRPGAAAMFSDIDAEISPDAPDLGKLVAVALAHGLDVAVPPLEEVAG
ncbi:MAG: cupin domain-containing protein [Actinomycetota bacterium]|nr:cupin domain-containing protein [Acidimicrobiia bacterium]MDQ3293522.1 cupin domain-containing protein [Actinomycetota bacterium]